MSAPSIFLYGVPGSGKTSIAEALSRQLELECLELDTVRHAAQKGEGAQTDPFLLEYTTTAWRQFGDLSEGTAVKGFAAVRKVMQPFVLKELESHPGPVIAEAAFLDPAALKRLGECFLIVCPDKAQHYKQFFVHRERTALTDQQFAAATLIESYLVKEAGRLGISVVNNDELSTAICQIRA